MASSTELPCFLAVAGSIVSQVMFFNRLVCHMQGLFYLNTFHVTCATSMVALDKVYGHTTGEAIGLPSRVFTCYLVGACGSLLTYRIFLKPFNRFLGPWPTHVLSLMSFQFGNEDAFCRQQRQYHAALRRVQLRSRQRN